MNQRSGGGGKAAAPNPMPALTPVVLEALTESIRVHGVIVPVVKDQTGFVLEGANRLAIAAELGVVCEEKIHHCTPDQREILRIELNGARRQLTAQQWKPLVDHLRAQMTRSGARQYSDREIARAVGVSAMTVSRYKPPMATVTSDTVAVKATGKDGRVRNQDPRGTATDRVLHLIRQSTTGLTAVDLRRDAQLQNYGSSTVGKIPGQLHERGLIEPTEPIKRGRTTVWRAVTAPVTPPPKTAANKTVTRKAEQVIENLKDARVRDAVKETVASDKELRQAGTALRAAEKELDAALLAEEKRAADNERERLKLIEISRDQASKSIKTWEKLIYEVRAAWVLISAYSVNLDDLPALTPAFERSLDRELDELRQQMGWLDKKLHPGGNRNPVHAGTIIDVNSN